MPQIAISMLDLAACNRRGASARLEKRTVPTACCSSSSSTWSSLSVARKTRRMPVASWIRRTCVATCCADCSTPGCDRRTSKKSVRRQWMAKKGAAPNVLSTNWEAAWYVAWTKWTLGRSVMARACGSWSVTPEKASTRCGMPPSVCRSCCSPGAHSVSATGTRRTPFNSTRTAPVGTQPCWPSSTSASICWPGASESRKDSNSTTGCSRRRWVRLKISPHRTYLAPLVCTPTLPGGARRSSRARGSTSVRCSLIERSR
mmetsp:Transcript_29772/g.94833  ORF Transcript_29772/g.94833 Transcript_29772/m.94833 type:complete len:259 (+) Transcript_29772:440-1216(+)|eukprot:scaffold6279_cov228-Isochrysis_galbana.AAC.12